MVASTPAMCFAKILAKESSLNFILVEAFNFRSTLVRFLRAALPGNNFLTVRGRIFTAIANISAHVNFFAAANSITRGRGRTRP